MSVSSPESATVAELEAALEAAQGAEARVDALTAVCRALYQRGLDTERAGNLAREALALAERSAYPLGVMHSLLALGWCHFNASNFVEAVRTWLRGLDLCRDAGQDLLEVRFMNSLGPLHIRLGDYPAALHYQVEVLRRSQASGDVLRQATSLDNLGLIHKRLGQAPQSLACHLEALELAAQVGDRFLEGGAALNASAQLAELGQHERAWTLLDRAQAEALALGHRELQAQVQTNRAHILLLQGRFQDVIETAEAALALAEEVRDRDTQCAVLHSLGEAHVGLGRAKIAVRHLRTCLQRARDAALPHRVIEAHTALARAHEQQGDFAAALQHTRAARALEAELRAEQTEGRVAALTARFEAERLRHQVELERARGAELAGALAELRRADQQRAELFLKLAHLAEHDSATDLPNEVGFGHAVTRALSRARATGRACALALLDIEHFKALRASLGPDGVSALWRAVIGRVRAQLTEGETLARTAPDEFAVLFEELSSPGEAAERTARVLASLREPLEVGGAQVSLRVRAGSAVYPYDGADGHALTRHAEVTLVTSGQDPAHSGESTRTCPPGHGGAVPELSAREAEVLAALAAGRSGKQIGRELGISERTVRFHVSSIFNKLGVNNRAHAVSVASQLGLASVRRSE